MAFGVQWARLKPRGLKVAFAPVFAVAATLAVSSLGIVGLASGAGALRSALQAASSAHELETIAAGMQRINGDLYHVLTLRGARTVGFDAARELHPLLEESDRVAGLLRDWRDTRATAAQKPRVTALIAAVRRYRGAVDFVSQMLDVDFDAAVSFVRPFDSNFHDLMQSVNSLVGEVQMRERRDADGALLLAGRTVRAFEAVVIVSLVLALLSAAGTAKTAMRSRLLARQNSQLANLAQVDALTGMGNRRCFDDALEAAWASCTARQMPLALVMFDVDHFKKYNDSQGHPAGDLCLRRIGGAVPACTRGAQDLPARYGGEEFAIIMPGANLEAGRAVAERVRKAVADCAIPHPAAGQPGVVTVSLGVASLIPTASTRAGALVEAADRGLYAAKRGGRNRVGVEAVEGMVTEGVV
jgi:diguanylate cyclase (GGDEF)-like protein